MDAVRDADALLIATEWPEYRNADWPAVCKRMALPHVLDGRNICNPARMAELGFVYRGVGRHKFEKFAATPALPVAAEREPQAGASFAVTPSAMHNAPSGV
jgi:UDPglucose 6-dehydrogenase